MLLTSTPDGSATHNYSKTCTSTDSTPPTDAITTANTDKVNVPPPLFKDCKDTLQLMQKSDPFCKCIFKWLLNSKALSHEADTFRHIKGHLYKHVMDSNQKFLAIVIPKSWCFTVLLKLMIN